MLVNSLPRVNTAGCARGVAFLPWPEEGPAPASQQRGTHDSVNVSFTETHSTVRNTHTHTHTPLAHVSIFFSILLQGDFYSLHTEEKQNCFFNNHFEKEVFPCPRSVCTLTHSTEGKVLPSSYIKGRNMDASTQDRS